LKLKLTTLPTVLRTLAQYDIFSGWPPSTVNVTRYGYVRRLWRVGFLICRQTEKLPYRSDKEPQTHSGCQGPGTPRHRVASGIHHSWRWTPPMSVRAEGVGQKGRLLSAPGERPWTCGLHAVWGEEERRWVGSSGWPAPSPFAGLAPGPYAKLSADLPARRATHHGCSQVYAFD
jgi:hypothetical protein